LRVLYWNLNVLSRNKIVYLERVLQLYDVLVFVELGRGFDLVEVWEQMGFTAYMNMQSIRSMGAYGRPLRGAGKGEGICVLVRNNLNSKLIKHTPHATWVEIR
jgi:hypothetical protein